MESRSFFFVAQVFTEHSNPSWSFPMRGCGESCCADFTEDGFGAVGYHICLLDTKAATLPETNIDPQKGWFPIGISKLPGVYFQGLC